MKPPKPKKCKQCKKEFVPFRSTERVCSIGCAFTVAKMAIREDVEKALSKKMKDLKANYKVKHKSLSEYEAEAKTAFQRWIRERDSELPCISCGNPKAADWAGGHYFAAGQYSGLIFDETNCHKQCNTYCNMHLSGNLLEYRKGLIKRYGIEYVEIMEEKSNRLRNYKYTKSELIELKKKYSKPFKIIGIYE